MNSIHRAALIGGLALAAGLAAPAAHAANTVTGYAQVLGTEPVGTFVDVPDTRAFNSLHNGDLTVPPARVFHVNTGRYELRFKDLAVLNQASIGGTIQVHSTGPTFGICQPNGKPAGVVGNELQLFVTCYDGFGRPTNAGFILTYTRGGGDTGELIVGRTETVPSSALSPLPVQETTLNGTVTPGQNVFVKRTGIGAYTFELPPTASNATEGPAVTQISPVDQNTAGTGAVTCGILSSKLAPSARAGNPLVRKIKVQCRGPLSVGPVDVPLNITHVHRGNLLGPAFFSNALVSAPLTTAATTVLPADRALSSIGRGGTFGVTLLRTSTGRYEVDLAGQGSPLVPAVGLTAFAGTATCQTTSIAQLADRTEAIRIACSNNVNQPVDTAFQLLFAGRF